ncbi:MAG TPA: lysophospholipid acyltransferase family protein [Thermodesulfovibrionales bacterium]|nr:lysophospholipid acyltransferase family protein [Thermodesulfovibrionales bacterium]
MNLLKFYLKTGAFLTVTLALAPFYVFILLILYGWRKRIGPVLVQYYSKLCLLIFRVDTEVLGNPGMLRRVGKGVLIIANHASFLDIFVLSALFGSVFVSKSEVKYYPIIGQIAWLMGVIFLDRRSANERMRVLNRIVNNCENQVIAVFPQGTTSGITERLPFNRGIFKVVQINPDISLLPVTLRYREDAKIAWNKPQSLRENALRVSSERNIHVAVIVHDPIAIDHYQGKTASEICRMVQQTVLDPLQTGHRNSWVRSAAD